MNLRFPNESAEYRAARDRLTARESELRRLNEAVARERRALPAGGAIPEDYVFEQADEDGSVRKLKLSELFTRNHETLAVYSYMFGPERETPCPMCTPLLDGLNGVVGHLEQRLDFVIVAESSATKLARFAKERGWSHRLLSTAGSNYNRDYYGKTDKGEDTTMLNVFRRMPDGVRHFWGTELVYAESAPGQDHRALDPVNPIFAMFDLTPEGRGDFRTKLTY